MSAYREQAERDEYPEERKPAMPFWTRRKAGIAGMVGSALLVDAGVAMDHWGQITIQSLGPVIAIHAAVVGVTLLMTIPLWWPPAKQ